MEKIELMSPAGSLRSFIAAIEGEADSIYLGLKKFNARKPAENFDLFTLKKVVEFAHSKNVKIYVTLNIDIKPNEINEVAKILQTLYEIKVDAIIIKDLGILYLINKFFKDKIELHASTQMAITTSEGAKFCEKYGFKRIVLARELTLEEIKKIKKETKIQLEVFVEGSMCFSISGRCLMSSWVGGRSGNRGCCTAPCRLIWENNGEKRSFFSMKDLNLILRLNDLKEAGVDALKIEGRLKNPNWVWTITKIYRNAIESVNNSSELLQLREELKKYSAREISEGHLFSHKNLVGENNEWQNYRKDEVINFSIDENIFKPVFQIEFFIASEKINVQIKIENTQKDLEYKKIEESKKGKNTNFFSIKEYFDKLEYTILLKIIGDDFQCSLNNLEKFFENIKSEINLIYKKLNDYHSLSMEVVDFTKFKENKNQKSKKLGQLPDKIIINNEQIDFFINNKIDFVRYLVIPINHKLDLDRLKNLKENYELIFSIPPVIYQDDIVFFKDFVRKIFENGYSNFEVNSLTGINLISNYDCKKFTGIGFTVLNHIAANFLKENENFFSVMLSYEAEEETISTLSKLIDIKVDILMFSKLSLFISRTEENSFINGKKFRDRIGTEIETIKKEKLFHFVTNKYFLLYGKEIENKNIFCDFLTADFSNINQNKISHIIEKLKYGKFEKDEYSTFNFFEKLV